MQNTDKLIHSVSGDMEPMPVGQKAELMICVSQDSKGGTLLCDRINISVPVGDDGESLFTTSVSLEFTVETEGWSPLNQGDPEVSKDGKSVVYALQSDGGIPSEVKEPVVCKIAGVVTKMPGYAPVRVSDHCESYEENNMTVHYVMKGDAKPYLRNFMTFGKMGSSVPMLYFAAAQEIVFTWESKDGQYRVYNGRTGEIIYEGDSTCFGYKKGITEDTPFILEAKFVDKVQMSGEVKGRSEKILYAVLPLYTDKQEYFADRIFTNRLKVYDEADLPK